MSSDGTVNVYDLSLLPSSTPIEASGIPEISPVVTYDSKGSRLTCITLAEGDVDHSDHTPVKGAKRKRDVDSEAEEEEEWEGFS